MQTITLSRWGNSLGLRLPKGVIEGQRLHAGDKVTVELVGRGYCGEKKGGTQEIQAL
jgi:antitoxin component of MazEF toxin-antitoxin module